MHDQDEKRLIIHTKGRNFKKFAFPISQLEVTCFFLICGFIFGLLPVEITAGMSRYRGN